MGRGRRGTQSQTCNMAAPANREKPVSECKGRQEWGEPQAEVRGAMGRMAGGWWGWCEAMGVGGQQVVHIAGVSDERPCGWVASWWHVLWGGCVEGWEAVQVGGQWVIML